MSTHPMFGPTFANLDQLSSENAIIISEEVGASKPDPAMVYVALKMAEAKPAEAVLLGDGVTADIPAARNAGVDSIFINHEGKIPGNHGADYAVTDLAAAQRIILEK